MSAFLLRENPIGVAMTDADFLTSALEQPLSRGSTILSGMRSAPGVSFANTAMDLTEAGAPAPTEPGLIYAPPEPEGQAQPERLVEDTREARAMLSGAARGRFAQPVPFRSETPEELEARRAEAGAMSEEAWQSSAHFREGVEWDRGMTGRRAEAIAKNYDARKVREFYEAKRPWSAFAGQFVGEFANPTNFIPFAGPAVRAAAVARAGRVGGTALVGAIDAAGGAALSGAITVGARDAMGEEVTWQGTVSDIAISALVGAAFGAGLGGVSKLAADRRARLQAAASERLGTLAQDAEARIVIDEAARQIANGDPVNLSPASQAFAERAAERTFDFIRAAEADPSLVRASVDRRFVVANAMDPHAVSAADGSSIDVLPRIVEARDLITSADEGFDAGLQPRQRDRAAAQAQIRQIATALDPQRLGMSAEADRGAPIVGPDRMVESGNGRVLAIRQVYQEGGEAAARYRAFLEAQGVDLDGFEQPVLVRERQTSMDAQQRQAFAVAANRPATLAMSATERARADAAALTPEALSKIRNTDDLGAAANTDFLRDFMRALPGTEAGALTTPEGRVSTEGLTRVRNAILAAAYGDADTLARVTEATDDSVRSISKALTTAAPEWARFRRDVQEGRVPAALDVTPALLEAVTRTADLRAQGVKLADHLRQADAFDAMPESVEGFMRLFYDVNGRRAASAEKISDALNFYAWEARKVSTDAGLDLGLPVVQARELIEAANARRIDDGSGSLFGAEGAGDGPDVAPGRVGAGGRNDADPRLQDGGRSGERVEGNGRAAEAAELRLGPLNVGKAAPLLNADEALAVTDASRRVGMREDAKAIADQYGVDPKTGEYAERADVEQIREEGRLTDEDEAELLDADKTFELGEAYGEALRASVRCLI